MSLLREIQENFQRYLQEDRAGIENYIATTETDFANERLFIYKDAYYIRLIDALEKNYPGVLALLGPCAFDKMASLYINERPSRHFSINEFGKSIPEFLSETEPYKNRGELAEMAQFELALDTAIHILEAPVLAPESFMQITPESWPQVRIKPHPSAQILYFRWNVPEIWQPAYEKQSLPELKETGPTPWLIWQKNINTFYVMLNAQDVFIMEAMKKNLCVAEICEGLCEWLDEGEVAPYLVKTTMNWLHDKLLSQLDLG